MWGSNKHIAMKSENKLLYFILLSVVFILFTTKYFNFEENLIYGGSDGRYYISISSFQILEED